MVYMMRRSLITVFASLLLLSCCCFDNNNNNNAVMGYPSSKSLARRRRRARRRRATRPVVRIPGGCMDGRVATSSGGSCGVPPFVNATEFGDNLDTTGMLLARRAARRRRGDQDDDVLISIRLRNLPLPNLTISAWLEWIPIFTNDDPETPSVFNVAEGISPCAPFTAGFTSGLGREPNQLVYVSGTSAILKTRLNFNPTMSNQGPLIRRDGCIQATVEGIQETKLRQEPAAGDALIPTAGSYLRRFDPSTGFQILTPSGIPDVARSPVAAISIAIIAHLDRTTHGVDPGIPGVDHYELLRFPLEGVEL